MEMPMMKKMGNILLMILFMSFLSGIYSRTPSGLQIGSLSIKGNYQYHSHLLKQMLLSRPGRLGQRRSFIPELLEQDTQNLRRYYHQNGFLEAKVVSHVRTDTLKNSVAVGIEIHEGERTYIEGIHLFGNETIADSLLKRAIHVSEGRPLAAKNINESQSALLRSYAEQGYLDALIDAEIKTNPESHRAIVNFQIIENQCSRLHEVRLSGNQKTRSGVLFRELKIDSGKIIRYSRLIDSQKKLYLTGLFQSVIVHPAPQDSLHPEMRDILIDVQEQPYHEFITSAGFGSEDKLRSKIEFSHKNLNGTARKVGFQAWLSFIERGVMVSASDPWMLDLPITADLNLSTEFKDEPGYDMTRTGGQCILGSGTRKHSDFHITLKQDYNKFTNVRTLPEDEAKARIRSARVSAIYDSRDNLFDPGSGFFCELSAELAHAVFEEPVTFSRWETEIRTYLPFHGCVAGTAMEFGWLVSRSSVSAIPLNERYYAGGQGSIRGYDYKRVGPLNEQGIPTGGILKCIWRVAEIRFPIHGVVHGAVFMDSGSCWADSDSVRLSGFRSGAGLGLRLHTFLGIARLDYAWKLNRKPGEKAGAWIFNMGHAF
jgi:outer membrane protein insertion porin family